MQFKQLSILKMIYAGFFVSVVICIITQMVDSILKMTFSIWLSERFMNNIIMWLHFLLA